MEMKWKQVKEYLLSKHLERKQKEKNTKNFSEKMIWKWKSIFGANETTENKTKADDDGKTYYYSFKEEKIPR